jgi:hypothetical protein
MAPCVAGDLGDDFIDVGSPRGDFHCHPPKVVKKFMERAVELELLETSDLMHQCFL